MHVKASVIVVFTQYRRNNLLLLLVEFYVCAKCGSSKEDVEGSQHKWWHTLLTLRDDIVEHESQRRTPIDAAPETTKPTTEKTSQENGLNEPLHDSIVSAINSMVEEKMSSLESNLKANNSALDERITGLEAKMDHLIVELKGWLNNGRNS